MEKTNMILTADEAYNEVMDLPLEQLRLLRDKLTSRIRTLVRKSKAPSFYDELKDCCGLWADDSRTTEQIRADIRNSRQFGITREQKQWWHDDSKTKVLA